MITNKWDKKYLLENLFAKIIHDVINYREWTKDREAFTKSLADKLYTVADWHELEYPIWAPDIEKEILRAIADKVYERLETDAFQEVLQKSIIISVPREISELSDAELEEMVRLEIRGLEDLYDDLTTLGF